MYALLNTYPTSLRATLLNHLHEVLILTLPSDPAALKLYATRFLPEEANESETFIDQLRAANEALLEKARTHRGAVSGVYAEFVEEWCHKDIDCNLVCCLASVAVF